MENNDNICVEHDFSSMPLMIRNEPIDNIYHEIAYVVCKKCGQIRRQELPK